MLVPVDSIQPHPRNARLGATAEITASLEEYGQFRPLTVNKRTGDILKGNNTYSSIKALGWDEVDVVYVDVSDKEAKRILLADNRTHERGTYDSDILQEVLTSVGNLAPTGYDESFLESLSIYDESLFDTEEVADVDPMVLNVGTGFIPEPVVEAPLDGGLDWVPEVEFGDIDEEDPDALIFDRDGVADDDDMNPMADMSSLGDTGQTPARAPDSDDPYRSMSDYKRTHLIRCGGLSAVIEPNEYQRWWDESLETHGSPEAAGEFYRVALELPPPCEKPKTKRVNGTSFVTDAFDQTPDHELGVESVEIDSLQAHPQNPRQGDVTAIAQSLRRNGQFAPIIVNADNTILAGRHTWAAAKMLDWSTIAIHRVDVDEETALAILLADNRTADLGTNSVERVASLIGDLDSDVTGTGYTGMEVARLLQTTEHRPVVGHKRSISQIGTPKMPFTRLTFDDFVTWKDKVQAEIGKYDDKSYVEHILSTIGIDPTAVLARKRREGTAV